ncbi:M14 family zinc carboxypeptidase [Mesoterricola silvestris]|uniref:Peptidase M14 domain-containing protein n=1 Tax=Mesoterricola silvestris TaxID=2927979 RepID=A0AA48GRU8_9BACT|nr:M14 family zinc carboxypeptidase [Mesoterricola silvestris]BDU72857.1 hypothetical protein METEAL_20310 [Mesoterricola silvestris]
MRPLLVPLTLACSLAAAAPWPAQALWDQWPTAHVSPADPWVIRHAGLQAALAALQSRHPGLFTVVEEGLSSEGRRIQVLRAGTGPRGVLLWSQMHGDEPTATAALLDLMNWLGLNRDDPEVKQFLSRVSLWIIPMLNPDGAERGQRRNAQEIDINRDALRLSSPEGRLLKAVRDRVRPMLGYNLHNQNPLVKAGPGGRQVALSLLSVPGDEACSETPGTRLTRRLAVKVQQLVAPFAPNRVGRYDMDYTPRAFGDSMTRWGTATLLVEAGGWSGPNEAERLVRLNFVALLGSLSAFADGSLDDIDLADYAKIPLNTRDAMATLVVRNARVLEGRGLAPFTADFSFVVQGPFRGDAPRREPLVQDLGDLSYATGLTELDASGLVAVPWPLAHGDWASLHSDLHARGLADATEAHLAAAVHALGDAAVARPGFRGAVLLYRPGPAGILSLAGAVLHGKVEGPVAAQVN